MAFGSESEVGCEFVFQPPELKHKDRLCLRKRDGTITGRGSKRGKEMLKRWDLRWTNKERLVKER